MTKLEILDAFLDYNKLRRVDGESWDPLMPFLLMDCVYQIYDKDIKTLPLRHESKQIRNIWRDNYNKLNKHFFLAFNEEQEDEVIKMMDEFEAFIKNDLDRTKFAFMNCINDQEIEDRKIIASCLLVCSLTCAADYIFAERFKDLKVLGDPRGEMDRIHKSASRLANKYYHSSRNTDPTGSPELGKLLQALCNKVILFLMQ